MFAHGEQVAERRPTSLALTEPGKASGAVRVARAGLTAGVLASFDPETSRGRDTLKHLENQGSAG
ncbi:hypothetical protein [Streptomyces sp. NPDC086182]|uniref:hypothetical protein n=1 Tax=Streptomyces sp. NPDC086182 TaxID=3155058 RepID=UPI00342EE92C